MNKVRLLQSIVLINVLIANFGSVIPTEATVKQPPQNLLRNTNNTYLSLVLRDLFTLLRRPKVPAGGRGEVCAIAPQTLVDPALLTKSTNNTYQEIWNLQPLFLWYPKQETVVKRIELFKDGSDRPFWEREISPGQTSIIYDGEPLQQGQLYHWRLHIPFPIDQPSFQIMEQQKRNEITNELKKIEDRFKQQGASAETIALAKVEFLSNENLWSDALRETYAVPNPSPELKKIQQEIPSFEYCQTKDNNTPAPATNS